MVSSQLLTDQSLRGNQTIEIDTDSNIRMQIIDWKSNDMEIDTDDNKSVGSNGSNTSNIEYLITLYGITNTNHSICINVTGFKPYFYIKIPEKWSDLHLKQYLNAIINKIPKNQEKYKTSVLESKILKKKIFRGFTNYKQFKFGKLYFKNKKAMMLVNYIIKNNNETFKEIQKKQLIKKKMTDENKKRKLTHEILILNKKIIKVPYLCGDGEVIDIYESNIDPVLRFIHETDISPCGWIEINKNKYQINEEEEDNISNCHINITTEYDNIKPYDKDDINKIIVASFDIECDSSHGDFPIASKDYTQLASFIYDKYHIYLDKLKDNKQLSKKKEYQYIHQPLEFIRDIIQLSFINEENAYEVPYIYTKQNKKPTSQEIDNIFTNYCCPNCKNSIRMPFELNSRQENDIFIFETEEKDINYYHKKGSINHTLKLSIKEDKKDKKAKDVIWNDVEIKCQHNLANDKPCDYTIGRLVSKLDDKVEYHIKYKNIDFMTRLLKTKPDKKEEIRRDDIIYGMTNILNKHLPLIKGDKIIQIGTVLQRYGEPKPFLKHICTLGSCDEIENCIVESFENEKDLLIAWSKFMTITDPDFITGYNIFGFDYNFMWERAKELNCVDEFSYLGKNKQEKSNLIDKTLSSAGLGDNILKYIVMSGRVQMDLLKIIQRDHNLTSYKLDDVSSEFINGSIKNIILDNENNQTILDCDNVVGIKKLNYVKLSYKDNHGEEYYHQGEKLQIIDIKDKKLILAKLLSDIDTSKKYKWGLSKDDVGPKDIFEMQKKGSKERAIIAKYCIQDCELCLDLCNKLDIVSNNIGMANVCKVPLSFIFLRGQGIKIFSLVSKQCALEDYVIPLLEKVKDEDKEGYEGAIVLPPKPGIYLDEPVSVLDYSSLYPSSMISENLSHETICTDEKWLGSKGAKELQKLGYTYKDITYDNYKYIKKGKALVKIINKDKPKMTCRFVQPTKDNSDKIIEESRAVIPRILRKLLKARKDTRKKIPLTDDPFKKSVLDGLQLAYKVTANSLYGSIGASTSQIAFKEIAASTTATGRRLIYLAKNFVEENYPGSETVYGDTDSVFINFNPKDDKGNKMIGYEALKKSIELGTEAGKRISTYLEEPHDLEYEKTFWPFILLSKKRYVGNKYEDNPDYYKETSMGIVLKRRDNAQIVKYIYGGCINIIMNQRDIQLSIDFLKKSLKELTQGKFNIDKLVITKSLKAYYKDPEQIAHKVLADRIGRRDPGNKPQPNDRIPYVYIRVKEKKDTLQGDKIELPSYIIENKLPIDYNFYITNQIMKPVCQIYALIVEDLKGFKYHKGYYPELEKSYLSSCNTIEEKKKKKDKIQDLKMKEVENLLFGEALREGKHKKNGTQDISKWFIKKT